MTYSVVFLLGCWIGCFAGFFLAGITSSLRNAGAAEEAASLTPSRNQVPFPIFEETRA